MSVGLSNRFGGSVLKLCALVAALALAALSAPARADLVRIGELPYAPSDGRTPGVDGVAFDGNTNPVVLDRLAWTLTRVDQNNGAAVVGTVRPAPFDDASMGGLAYQPGTGKLYSVAITGAPVLARIDPAARTVNLVGSSIGVGPTFASLAFDTAGKLWLLSGDNGGELWTVDPATGRGIRRTSVHFPSYSPRIFTGAISALAINDRDQFVVAATLDDAVERLFRVDPVTGNATPLGETGLKGGLPRLDALAYDPATGKYYGVENQSGTFYLDEVRGVPEPGAACFLLPAVAVMIRRRRRGREV